MKNSIRKAVSRLVLAGLVTFVAWPAVAKDPPAGDSGSQVPQNNAAITRSAETSLTLVETDQSIEIQSHGQIVLRYNKSHVVPPDPLPAHFGRSGHLHPVRTPKGMLVTDEFPPDHAHQSGIYLGYPKAEYDGHPVDFWNLAKREGCVRFKRSLGHHVDAKSLWFEIEQEHVDKTKAVGPEPKVVLIEKWRVTIEDAGWSSGHWSFTIESELSCATDKPLVLPEYHYGGMAMRGAREWVPEKVRIVTATGVTADTVKQREAANHVRTPWCAMMGNVGGQPVGVVMITDTSNVGYPEPLRIHPTMPYMVYTPSQLGRWTIAPGQVHRSKYKFVVFDGDDVPASAIPSRVASE